MLMCCPLAGWPSVCLQMFGPQAPPLEFDTSGEYTRGECVIWQRQALNLPAVTCADVMWACAVRVKIHLVQQLPGCWCCCDK